MLTYEQSRTPNLALNVLVGQFICIKKLYLNSMYFITKNFAENITVVLADSAINLLGAFRV